MTAGDTLIMTAGIKGLDDIPCTVDRESNETHIRGKFPGTDGMMTFSVMLTEANPGGSRRCTVELPDGEIAE